MNTFEDKFVSALDALIHRKIGYFKELIVRYNRKLKDVSTPLAISKYERYRDEAIIALELYEDLLNETMLMISDCSWEDLPK